GSERNIPDRCGMANACVPDSPCRHVHDPDVVDPLLPLIRALLMYPEDRTLPAQVELGIDEIVPALRLPRPFGGREWGPAVGTLESPESPVAVALKSPGRDESPVRAVLPFTTSCPSRMSKPDAGRPGWPGPGVEDPALDGRNHGSAVRWRAFVQGAEGGGD